MISATDSSEDLWRACPLFVRQQGRNIGQKHSELEFPEDFYMGQPNAHSEMESILFGALSHRHTILAMPLSDHRVRCISLDVGDDHFLQHSTLGMER